MQKKYDTFDQLILLSFLSLHKVWMINNQCRAHKAQHLRTYRSIQVSTTRSSVFQRFLSNSKRLSRQPFNQRHLFNSKYTTIPCINTLHNLSSAFQLLFPFNTGAQFYVFLKRSYFATPYVWPPQKITLVITALCRFLCRNLSIGNFNLQISFSLGLFVLEKNIWNALSLSFTYLGASWLQAHKPANL